jgi:osmotically-inducible protein OsmY
MADRYFDPERWRSAEDDRYREEWRRTPRYQDREHERFDRDWGRGSGERGDWRSDYGRGWQSGRSYGRDERGFWERFGDEVRSWFGDEEAQRRRMMDDGVDWTERRRPWQERQSWERPMWSERRSGDDRSWWDRQRWPSDDVSRQWGSVDRGEMSGRGLGRDRSWDRYGAGVAPTGGYEPSGGTEYYGQASPMSGPFTGRGPRGWQRSDDRIKEDICERMSHHGSLDASDLEVRVANCEVTLAGTVPDRDSKRIAEHIAESVSGVRDVHNQIRVSGGTGQRDSQQEGPGRSWSEPQRRIA